jgi:hypothetical protein
MNAGISSAVRVRVTNGDADMSDFVRLCARRRESFFMTPEVIDLGPVRCQGGGNQAGQGKGMVEMTDANAVVRRYVEIWNQPDGALRAKAAAELLTADCRFVDPIADVSGPDGLAAVIGGVHERFPGHRIRPLGEVDAHHDVLRFTWALMPDGGEAVVIGIDVLTLTEDGLVSAISGFFDQVPAA